MKFYIISMQIRPLIGRPPSIDLIRACMSLEPRIMISILCMHMHVICHTGITVTYTQLHVQLEPLKDKDTIRIHSKQDRGQLLDPD